MLLDKWDTIQLSCHRKNNSVDRNKKCSKITYKLTQLAYTDGPTTHVQIGLSIAYMFFLCGVAFINTLFKKKLYSIILPTHI